MKSLFKNLLLLSTMVSLVFLFSCGDDDPEEVDVALPAISITTSVNGTATTDSPVELAPGDEISFDVDVTAEGGFNVLRASYAVDGGTSVDLGDEVTRTTLGLDAGTTLVPTITLGTTVDASFVGSTILFEFEAVDDEGQIGTASVEATVNSPEARSYTAVLLAAPLQDQDGTTASKISETFFSTNTGLVYSMKTINESTEALSANIDFGYFYGSGAGGTEATLSDPASYPFAYGQAAWGVRNNTTFRRTSLDESAFIEASSYAAIDAAFEAADAPDSDPGIESGLVVNEVLAFETDSDKEGGSKRGLILVKAITPGDGENGKITLEILVQEPAE